MDNNDKKDFAVLFYGTGELYDKPVTKNLLQLYFNALIEYSVDDIRSSINYHILDHKHGSFFPKPADIVRHLKVNELSSEEKAELAWAQIEREIRKTGSWGKLEMDDKQALASLKAFTTWKGLCSMPVNKLTWAKKEFISMYSTYDKTPVEMLPSSLPGRIELVEHKNESSDAMSRINIGINNYRRNKNAL